MNIQNRTTLYKKKKHAEDDFKKRVEQSRETYLQETGVAEAVRDALKSLFAEPRLPDNPYYYLANLLSAYVDQSPLWKQSDRTILSVYDVEGSVEVLNADTKLCKHSATNFCYGLPHIVRLVSKDGADALHSVLTDGVPDTFFPSPMPFATNDGYKVQVLCSVQGSCTTWRPSTQEFPELEVRADVLVKGPRLEEAVRTFVDLVLTDMEEVAAVPVYFVDGLAIMDSPCQTYEGAKEPFYQFYLMSDILEKPEEFEKTARRLVLNHKVIKMSCVLMLETPEPTLDTLGVKSAGPSTGNAWGSPGKPVAGPGSQAVKGPLGPGSPKSPGPGPGVGIAGQQVQAGHTLRYEVATKTYYFHFAGMEESKVGYDQMAHYGTIPHEALFTGFFLTAPTARSYMALYLKTDKEPYAPPNLMGNMAVIKRQIERGLYHGNSIEAFRQLLQLIMLQDERVTNIPRLRPEAVRSLEELALGISVPGGRAPRNKPESELIFEAIPNLLRILTSAAAAIQGITRELEAISVAGTKWPTKLREIKASAAQPRPGGDYKMRPDGLYTAPGTGDSRRTLRTAEVSSAMVSWLSSFDMESRLLAQLAQLKAAIAASLGKGLFSGISTMVDLLLRDIPDEAPHTGAGATLMARIQPGLVQMVQLLKVGSTTVAHGFLGRCADVLWAMGKLGITVVSLIEAHHGDDASFSGAALLEEQQYIPDFVLDVRSVVGSQVRGGALAARVGPEGVALQYAVDTKLDEALAAAWLQVSQPPQPLNPFPKLMHIIRSRAARMELWHHEIDEALAELLNELALVRPPAGSWIYAATPSPAGLKARARRTGRRTATAAEEDEEMWQVYGCYAAVALADARALQALRTSLPTLLADRHWQSGAYAGEVVPALVGPDVAMSNALELEDAAAEPPAVIRGMRSGAARPPFEHPRSFAVVCEEHHLVAGPKRKDAARAFAEHVVAGLDALHRTSPHIVHRVEVFLPQGSKAEARALHASVPPSAQLPRPSDAGDVSPPARPAAGAQPQRYARLGPPPDVTLGSFGPEPLRSAVFRAGLVFAPGDLGSAGRAALIDALASAACKLPQGKTLAVVHMYASALKEVAYVALRQRLLFQYQPNKPAIMPNQAMTHAAIPSAPSPRPSTADRDRAFWDRCVYERVFLSEFNASTWLTWNRERGDPTQPYHHQRLLGDAKAAVRMLESRGRLLDMQKTLLLCAVALQDDEGIYQLTRTCRSAAQELTALLDMNAALVDLLGPWGRADPSFAHKVDNERVRRLFLTYANRTRRAMSSPRSCYFTGLATSVPPVLGELAAHVLSTFTLGPRQLAQMAQLATWTRACAISVSAALQDCMDLSSHTTGQVLVGTRSSGGGAGGSAGAGAGRASGGGGAPSQVLRPGTAPNMGRPSTAMIGAGAGAGGVRIGGLPPQAVPGPGPNPRAGVQGEAGVGGPGGPGAGRPGGYAGVGGGGGAGSGGGADGSAWPSLGGIGQVHLEAGPPEEYGHAFSVLPAGED